MHQNAVPRVKSDDLAAMFDWERVARLVLTSRAIDHLEETKFYPEKKIFYQFSARGHDLAQILLGSLLTHRHDAVGGYYRSRPILLAVGLSVEDAIVSPLARAGGYSDGRDVGVVVNLPSSGGATVLPMAGDVGSQFTPCAGWAQAIVYRRDVLGEGDYDGALSCVLGGEGAVATNGFWSALTIAGTLQLPMLFYVEDNGYAISVPGEKQTPGGSIAENLASYRHLQVLSGDGSDPQEAGSLIHDAVTYVRSGRGPTLLHLTVPRLCGHSGQDTQAYKSSERIQYEQTQDPLLKLRSFLCSWRYSEEEWDKLKLSVDGEIARAVEVAVSRPEPDPGEILRFAYIDRGADGAPEHATVGGVQGQGFGSVTEVSEPEPARINTVSAIRRTLQSELRENPRVLLFGEDIGPKGGVHAVTMGLQEEFGERRVFDTSLSEEGIVGRAVGMAFAGLMPVVEIQFRKYADPATEQLNNCGTIRWRTANRFAGPIVVRIPVGFARCGDPWHSVSNEVQWIHGTGWQVFFPSNAEDAVGLLRSAIRSNNPSIVLEHRHLYDSPAARRPYPGDQYVVPVGVAQMVRTGEKITVVTWGAFVERCELAADLVGDDVEIIDLRSLLPWDRETVLRSVQKTHRCMVVHEDSMTAGFGAEVAATVAEEVFFSLDAPIVRIAPPDIPIPYNIRLMNHVLPNVEQIAEKMKSLLVY